MSTLPMFAGDNRLEVLANAEFLDASAAKRGLRPTRIAVSVVVLDETIGSLMCLTLAHRPISDDPAECDSNLSMLAQRQIRRPGV